MSSVLTGIKAWEAELHLLNKLFNLYLLLVSALLKVLIFILHTIRKNIMNKDTLVANTATLTAAGITMFSPVTILTILSLLTAITLNLVLIYKNTKNKS